MFPATDDSATIVAALRDDARDAGVKVRTRAAVTALHPGPDGWRVALAGDDHLPANAVLLATGSATSGFELAAGCGHTIVPPVPSLFTLNIADPLLADLSGVVVPRGGIRVAGAKGLAEVGPILITHWGLSGPAVLRLSAWGARHFHASGDEVMVEVDWTGGQPTAELDAGLQTAAHDVARQAVASHPLFGLPRRLWRALVVAAGIPTERRWADLGRSERRTLVGFLGRCRLQVSGRTTYKEEFVTCGGVDLQEVDFRNMASKVAPGLFLAGEVLDIDGLTGGFNFQSCWTTGWLAGAGLAARKGTA